MRVALDALSFYLIIPISWRANWAWGLPLIILTVLIHAMGLGLINQKAGRVFTDMTERRHPTVVFAVVMGTTTLLATTLHAVEAGIWAISYRFLGAIPDFKSAMLYSLNAITSYGHESLSLASHWQLMGAIEALNGCLLFGLTTAFLFGIIQKIWLLGQASKASQWPDTDLVKKKEAAAGGSLPRLRG
jgi:hypothetical protein